MAFGAYTVRINGEFIVDIARDESLTILAYHVDMFLFWRAKFACKQYTMSTDGAYCEDRSTTFILSDDSIQLGNHVVKPMLPFKVSCGCIYVHRKIGYVNNFIALSLAVNGHDLLY
jgi:hypothetical protein